MSFFGTDSEILEFSLLEETLTLDKLIEEEVLSRGADPKSGHQQIGASWLALTECAVKSKLIWSDSISPARLGLYSIGDGVGEWKWSDQNIRHVSARVIIERFLNPKRRQHALFLSMVSGSSDSSVRHLYNLIRKTLTIWLEDMTEASHDENIVAILRRILFRKFKISIANDNGVAKNSLEHNAIVGRLVEIMSKESQDWKPLPAITARGTPRKAKKGPFTMESIGRFADEISTLNPLPSKSQIYEALRFVLPKREGTASHRDGTRRVIFESLDLMSGNYVEGVSSQDQLEGNSDEPLSIPEASLNQQGEEEDIGDLDTEMWGETSYLDPFDMISSSNDEALANAARALLADLTKEEMSVLKAAKLEKFDNTSNQTVVESLVVKIRTHAEQYWVRENDLLLEAAEELEKNVE